MDSIVRQFLILSIFVTRTICTECPPIKSENANKACEFPGTSNATCEYSMRPGTRAYITCKPLFEYSVATLHPPYKETTCHENGTWVPAPFDCVPECGRSTRVRYDQIYNGQTTELGTFPWHVGVYHMDWTSGELEHICGGSLISTELVISAAHCVYDEDEQKLHDARNYAVAAGKVIRSYYESEDTQQKSQIRNIYVPNGYRGYKNAQRKDIAILRLHKRFNITNFVRLVCIDFDNTYTEEQHYSSRTGKVMGWGRNQEGYASEQLQEINLPYVDHNVCKKNAKNGFRHLVTKDKICAGYTNGSSTCQGDSGGGLCFRSESNKRWYLRGIVSSGDLIRQGNVTRCDNYYYTAFTNVARYTQWIKSVMTNARNTLDRKNSKIKIVRSCILPKPPTGGYFKHESCRGSCNYVPGMTFPMGSVLGYICEKGYSLQGNSTLICQNAVWSSRPTCIEIQLKKYCPPIPLSKNLEAVCQHDDLIVSCELDVVPGTIAALQCADKYRMNFNGDNYRLIQFICTANGTWNTDPAPYHCTPECGIAPVIDNFTHSVNGTEIYAGDVPWPVFTYREVGKKPRGNWCVGTLVTPDRVLMHGGCKKHLGSYDTRQDIGDLRVVDTFDGLLLDDFVNNPSYHQEHSVKNYRVHESHVIYYKTRNKLNNIMALRLKTPFIPSRHSSPLCMDWNLELDIPRAGELGMVFIEIKGKLSRYATLVIGNEECNRLLDVNGYSRPWHNEFCIEVPKDLNTDVHFAVRRNGVWYLAGYSQGHFRGNGRLFRQMFKIIRYHMNWIKQVDKDS